MGTDCFCNAALKFPYDEVCQWLAYGNGEVAAVSKITPINHQPP
jgi:hypothetical protein